MGFFDFMTEDIAIDLGTANTLIIYRLFAIRILVAL